MALTHQHRITLTIITAPKAFGAQAIKPYRSNQPITPPAHHKSRTCGMASGNPQVDDAKTCNPHPPCYFHAQLANCSAPKAFGTPPHAPMGLSTCCSCRCNANPQHQMPFRYNPAPNAFGVGTSAYKCAGLPCHNDRLALPHRSRRYRTAAWLISTTNVAVGQGRPNPQCLPAQC